MPPGGSERRPRRVRRRPGYEALAARRRGWAAYDARLRLVTRAETDGSVGRPPLAGPIAATVTAWVALCRRVGAVEPEPRLRWTAETLLERWTEPRRRYHNRTHLERVLGTLSQLAA